ncbi:MAG: zinc transporter [Rhodobacteraceae bacterium]|nr:zinc transporter [Paracoccaceae bacterium]
MSNKFLSTTSAFLLSTSMLVADAPKVTVDIAPVHSLVSKIMNGVGKPDLIIPAGASPHEYQLKPSNAKALEDADLVFWIGEDLTPWLEKGLSSLAQDSSITALLGVDGIELLSFREGALFEAHDHDDHDDHDDHGKKKHDDHDDHDDHGKKKHDDHDDHAHGDHDPHAWLSPQIAKVWLNVIAAKLSEADPDNAGKYFSNAKLARDNMDSLVSKVNSILDPIREKKFVVFHDAYQYFEKDFGISASGAISMGDASDPSPARLAEIRKRVVDEAVECVLAEPQYNQGLVKAVVEGTNANTAVIDPLGVKLESGPDLYENLIRNLATNLAKCF